MSGSAKMAQSVFLKVSYVIEMKTAKMDQMNKTAQFVLIISVSAEMAPSFIKHQGVMENMTALITQMSKAAKISPEILLKLVKMESNPSGAIGNVMVKKTALMALMSKIAKIA